MISIHQSQFLPWLPYFYKISKSNIFVVLDNVQFQKNGVQNRNMIKTPRGKQWLTVPVRFEFEDPINKVEIADTGIYPKLLKTIEINYKKSAFFNEIFIPIKDIFGRQLNNLHQLNKKLLENILKTLNIKTNLYFSSSIATKAFKGDLVIEIIKNFNDSDYLSGKGALAYMDLAKFKKAGIKVYVYDFQYARYSQLWDNQVGFVPELSILDLLFNNLEESYRYILSNGNIKRVT